MAKRSRRMNREDVIELLDKDDDALESYCSDPDEPVMKHRPDNDIESSDDELLPFQIAACGMEEIETVQDDWMQEELQQQIVQATNDYAKATMKENKYEQWTKVTCEVMRAYFGFHILMSINRLPSIDDYWSTNPNLRYGPIANRISRDRFRDIQKYLHFVDNDTLVPRGQSRYDRLGKVRPVIDYVTAKCKELYKPHREVAVDEAMIKFQGRSSLKQYMPQKPIKRGIKVWVLGDSHNGYFVDFVVYTGKVGDAAVKGLGNKVVLSLTSQLNGKHHVVYFDNFFTSVELLDELLKWGVYSCGTVRSNRKQFPKELSEATLKERGDSLTVQKGAIVASAWLDKKVVMVMSTSCHDPSLQLKLILLSEITAVEKSLEELHCQMLYGQYN
eukprot:Em0007g1047a